MTPQAVFDIFKNLFPERVKQIAEFQRVDDHSIKLTTKDKEVLIFSIKPEGWWNLESKKKGKKK